MEILENQDELNEILQETYAKGYNEGQYKILESLIVAMEKNKSKHVPANVIINAMEQIKGEIK